MKEIFKIIGVFMLLLITSCTTEDKVVFVQGAEPSGTTVETTISLKEKAEFNVGAAVKSSLLKTDAQYADAFKANFNQLTAEFEMKMDQLWLSENNYNWEAADYLVNFAQDNNIEVHGHALVWYRTFPDWFKNQSNDSIAFESKVKTYITDVVGRYKGKIKSWDVVNEVFADNGGARNEDVIAPLFNDPTAFYGRCFQYAKDADPDTKLFYNDYSVVIDEGKRESIKNMASRFKAEGFPIDGIGAQFHYGTDTGLTKINDGFTDLASTDLLIHISELDIKINVNKSNDFSLYSGNAQQQSVIYEAIVAMYETLPESQKFGISTWGVSDNYSWLKTEWHPKEFPLLFDADLNKKLAYQGFLNGLN
ncbi:endo-1,4-beta-xylanase [Polaribacter undariae]|uniref:Beta-xylanase n=1 Tax=Polaribacter sejongensis TaxID=985043 RepID=A0AAJ1QXU2_9FLAO|nr:endo-1,4-beta-xylanase [Polaribacter undariae]MDN3620100.1 endo-1,4-beta-xylanase [Polaribacter undariae]UWD32247.1 endo-1,4-beta-xylanase [Polaribacter undariae]